MKKSNIISLAFLLFLLSATALFAQPAILSNKDIFTPVKADNGMVVTNDRIATEIGLDVLKKGGNAVDAAVTVGLVMAVTMPRAGNIGGGGFMLIYSAKEKKVIAIDYREKAPKASYRDMFLNKAGDVDSELSRFSHLSAGVPGTIAGFALALERYGTIPLKEALAPAIRFAKKGFIVSPDFSGDIKKAAARLKKWPSSRKLFFKADGSFYEPGDRFIQEDLAKTLNDVVKKGIKGFYEGEVAHLIENQMKQYGGLITKADLKAYRPVVRMPVHGIYRGYDIFSMSPPSSGGVHIIQLLNILEGYDLTSLGHNSADTIHLMAEAMKHAYADRSKYLGDPDFTDIPVAGLTDKDYAKMIRSKINNTKPTSSKEILPGRPPGYESNETTHFSIVDSEGNAVSNTYTINFSFGSGIVVDGAGFLLNNEMDDFSAKPGVPNAYGLIGGAANAIEAGKRMLSSMSPTIVMKEGKPVIITGSPGGSRIITTTLQVLMNIIDHGMNIQEAVNAVRIHHQWLPDEIRAEEGLSPDTLRLLKSMGHTVVIKNTMGAASSIFIDNENGLLHGAADPRRSGLPAGF